LDKEGGMQKDLRHYLDQLKKADRLIEFSREVDPKSEFSRVRRAAENYGKALLFKSVKGSRVPLVNNLFGSRELLAILFETTPDRVVTEWAARFKKPVEPRLISAGPVKEVITTGTDVNIRTFPVIHHAPKDAGPYITAGIVIARDPETGIRNVSVNRLQVKTRNKLGFRMLPTNDLGRIFNKYARQGKDMEVAVAIGNHPFENLAATTKLPFGIDEFRLAGALRREPLDLVKCETVDLEVPAQSEIVLEGTVPHEILEPEAPFGDFQELYTPEIRSHVFHVQAITHRREPIFQTIQASSPEDVHLLALSREGEIYETVSRVAEVQCVSCVPMIFGCAISIRKRFEHEPKNVAAAAFGAYSWLKYCVVVDHDVNVYDMKDVWWAIAARSRPDTATFLMANALGFSRDPCHIHQSKLALDATAPLERWEHFERMTFPGAEAVRLEDYL
jgi:2,5-furandicarboxylate decarboxylase 1